MWFVWFDLDGVLCVDELKAALSAMSVAFKVTHYTVKVCQFVNVSLTKTHKSQWYVSCGIELIWVCVRTACV